MSSTLREKIEAIPCMLVLLAMIALPLAGVTLHWWDWVLMVVALLLIATFPVVRKSQAALRYARKGLFDKAIQIHRKIRENKNTQAYKNSSTHIIALLLIRKGRAWEALKELDSLAEQKMSQNDRTSYLSLRAEANLVLGRKLDEVAKLADECGKEPVSPGFNELLMMHIADRRGDVIGAEKHILRREQIHAYPLNATRYRFFFGMDRDLHQAAAAYFLGCHDWANGNKDDARIKFETCAESSLNDIYQKRAEAACEALDKGVDLNVFLTEVEAIANEYPPRY